LWWESLISIFRVCEDSIFLFIDCFPTLTSLFSSMLYKARPGRTITKKEKNSISYGTPTKCQVSKGPVSKRLKRQVYRTSGLQNVRFTKRQVYKTSGLQNVWLQKNIHLDSVLVVGGNPQVLLQPCWQAK
jgi:hypothetical protein